jgi:hypothetical protein
LAITTTSLPNGQPNVAYSQTLTASGGPTPYTWSISAGALPGGLTLNAATGVISGTPTNSGTFAFTVQARDANLVTATKALSITVVLPGIAFVQQVSATTTGARTLAATLPAAVTVSDLIVVSASGWGNLPVAAPVTDNAGNAYAIAGARQTTPGKSWSVIYYAANAKAGATTVTFTTAAAGTQVSMSVAEFSGVAAAAPLDKSAGAAPAAAGTAPSSGNMTPATTGELLIGSGTHDGTTTTTAGAGSTMIAVAEDSVTQQPLAMEYRVLTTTAATPATFTLASGFQWAQNGALFKHK